MENLKKAKERAENYLYRTIEQKWDKPGIPVLIKERGRPPRTIRVKMKRMDYFELMNWPLRFEAYSYLGNKYRKKISSFAIELRELWNEWIELNKKGHVGSEKIFWPTVYEVIDSIEPDRNEERFSGNELWNHISMFRAKEILGIGGYEAYFNEAKKRIIAILFSKPYISLSPFVSRVIWHIVRSPFLKFELSDHLKVIALKLIEDDDFVWNGFKGPSYQGEFAFILCFGNFGSDLFDSAKKAASKLIDEQDKNGSFDNKVLATCLSTSAIHYMKLDPSNSVCSKAIDYILKEQNKEGYWDFLFGVNRLPHYSTGWNILSTVVALETLELVTNNKPLPIWVEKAKPSDIYQIQKPSRVQPIVPFRTPKGINWHDISIYFTSEEVVQIKAGNASEGRDFIHMGFADRRKRLKERTPDWSWKTLREFAKHQKEISLYDKDVDLRIKRNLKSYVYVIRERLKYLFKINGDPFYPYNRKTRSWKARFTVLDTTQE